MSKVLWYCSDWANKGGPNKHGGVGYYRVFTPASHSSHEVTVINQQLDLPLDDFDIVVFKQITNPEILLPLVTEAKEKGKKLVMDLDDDFWAVEPHQPAYQQLNENDQERLRYFSAGMSFCDAVITSTQPLADKVKKMMRLNFSIEMPTYTIPNAMNVKDFNWSKPPQESGTVKMFWMGSVTHDEDLKMVMPAIDKLLSKHPKLVFHFAGGIKKEKVSEVFKAISLKNRKRLTGVGGTTHWNADPSFPKFLSGLNYDIAIAPLVDTEFNRSKSHIKWLESTTVGACVVASNVYPYSMPVGEVPTITNNVTGVLASPEQWFDALDELIQNPQKRKKLHKNAVNFIKKNWDISNWVNVWDETISLICQQAPETKARVNASPLP